MYKTIYKGRMLSEAFFLKLIHECPTVFFCLCLEMSTCSLCFIHRFIYSLSVLQSEDSDGDLLSDDDFQDVSLHQPRAVEPRHVRKPHVRQVKSPLFT